MPDKYMQPDGEGGEDVENVWQDMFYSFVVPDGTVIGYLEFGDNMITLGVDLNGNNKPDAVGKDLFAFSYSPDGHITYITDETWGGKFFKCFIQCVF